MSDAGAMTFQDRAVLVTGGGSGIGEAAAKAFAAHGARVAICGRTEEKLENTAEAARAEPGHVVPIQADVAKPEDMERLCADIGDRFGRLDVVFAHAGVNGVWAPIDEMTPDEWRRTIDINLVGAFNTLRYAVPMLKRRGGAIVITSSINGTTKFSDLGSSAYCASKAGQIALARLLAVELAEHGVRVNAILPGSIDTDVEQQTEMRGTRASEEYLRHPRGGGVPLTGGRPGSPEQVADLVLFLASERASHITGAVVTIDGGQSLIQG